MICKITKNPKKGEEQDTYWGIRKLTPKECFRLMGMRPEYIERIQKDSGCSNSAQYKLAGNSIVVDVMYHMFRKMWVERGNDSQQMSIFDAIAGDMPSLLPLHLKVFTAFSGYDSQCMALDLLHEHFPEFTYELVGWAEIEPNAIKAHNACYPQWADRNYGDISKIDWDKVPDFDFFTYSSPCQDFSQAGKQKGGTEGSGTRSSLLWECRRAILAKKPRWTMMENVAALVSQKFIGLFNKWQGELFGYGYENFAQVLNAKHYGVPQNRERIFLWSILRTEDMPEPMYNFPPRMKLKKVLADVLEEDVEKKYFLKDEMVKRFLVENAENKQDCIYVCTDHFLTDEEINKYLEEPLIDAAPEADIQTDLFGEPLAVSEDGETAEDISQWDEDTE